MKRSIPINGLFALLAVVLLPIAAQAHITGWITINNDGGTTANTITNVGQSTVIGGTEGYQTLAAFPEVTLADGQFVELTATYQVLGRTAAAGADLQRLRDQIRVGLFRAPVAADPVVAQGLTGYIIEHRNEMREVRTPIGAPATNQSPFVSARSGLINADTTGTSTGSYSTAAMTGVSGGNPDADEFTEEDLVAGVDVTLTIQYRIARDGANLDITGSIGGTPAIAPPGGASPPEDSDGVFLEHFSALNYNPMIDLTGPGSDNFDFKFNRIGFLMGGNLDLDLGPFAGDYNGDSAVDAADYVIWRENNNTSISLPNDSTPGTVDDSDFTVWATNAGKKVGTIVLSNVEIASGTVGLATGTSVPEPATLAMAIVAALAFGTARRKR